MAYSSISYLTKKLSGKGKDKAGGKFLKNLYIICAYIDIGGDNNKKTV